MYPVVLFVQLLHFIVIRKCNFWKIDEPMLIVLTLTRFGITIKDCDLLSCLNF